MIHSFRSFIRAALFFIFPITVFSQHLPEGDYHANRERSIDILHYRADLSFDFEDRRVHGKATIRFAPLSEITSFSLDAFGSTSKL